MFPLGKYPRATLLVLSVMAMVLGLVAVASALTVAPMMSIVLGLLAYVVAMYFWGEHTCSAHRAQEYENRFWTGVALFFSGAFVFVPDSPVAVGQWSPMLGFAIVTLFTFSVHAFDRQLHRSRIGRCPDLWRFVRGNATGMCVQDKCQRISVCLTKLDSHLLATNLIHMLWADMVHTLEKEIVTILTDAEPAELNCMLPKIGLGLLVYKIKDHDQLNRHRTMLLDLLAVSRLSVLNVTSRVLVLDALQKMQLGAHRNGEYYAKNILLNTKGDDLSELKTLTDAKGGVNSMHKLVYGDIKAEATRAEVLKHIATQAKVQAAHLELGTKVGSRRSVKAWMKILSDVDDTLTCSGGRFPSGLDRSYPSKSIYPGVQEFYREMDLGTNGPSEWPEGQVGNLVFLSARPHVYKDISESRSYAKFKRLQDEKGLYTSPSLLAGSLRSGVEMVASGEMESVAAKKFQNFAEYAGIYPEYKYVFIGDNGQGDVRAAEMMAEAFPDLLEAVYIHRVVPEERTFGFKGDETRRAWKRANIVFFDNYVEAANHAFTHGSIQAEGLQRIAQGAVQQFANMKFGRPCQRETQRKQLNQSCCKANELLRAAPLRPSWGIRAVQAFDDTEAVLAPFGRGIIVNFRPEAGVYEVLLDWSQKGAVESSASRRSSSIEIANPPMMPPRGSRSHAYSLHPPALTPHLAQPPRPTSFPPTSSTPAGILSAG